MIRRAARPDEAGVRQNEIVKTIWTGRMAQAAGKYGKHAPMATACCNACRTCVTTNIVAAGAAASQPSRGTSAGLSRDALRTGGEEMRLAICAALLIAVTDGLCVWRDGNPDKPVFCTNRP